MSGAGAPKEQAPRAVVSQLQRFSWRAFAAVLLVAAASHVLRRLHPPAGADAASQLPWAAPFLEQLAAAHAAAALEPGAGRGPRLPSPGWAEEVLRVNTSDALGGGLLVHDERAGAGPRLSPASLALLSYKLYAVLPSSPSSSAFVFSQSAVRLRLNGEGALLLPGQLRALQGMRRGGARRAVIPPALGFGGVRRGLVPPFATLLFFAEFDEAEPEAAQPEGW